MRNKKGLSMVFILGLLVVSISTPVFLKATIFANGSDCTFPSPNSCDPGGGGEGDGISVPSNITIQTLLVQGGACFIDSYSSFQKYLRLVEFSETNYIEIVELKPLLDASIKEMEKSNQTYILLIQIARSTPYDPTKIEKLKEFDYTGFRERKQLNPYIYKYVEGYLASGNIRGAYSYIQNQMQGILAQMYSIKDAGSINLGAIFELNNKYFHLYGFGQYIAQTFMEIN